MSKKLSTYIDLARKTNFEKRLLSKTEIRSRIGNKSDFSKQIKLPKIKGSIIMTTFISILVTMSFIMFSGITESINQSLQQSINKNTKNSKTNNNFLAISDNNNQNILETNFKGIPLIKLTDKELEKLEIYKIKSGYKITCEKRISLWKDYEKTLWKIAKAGYDTLIKNGLYRRNYYLNGYFSDGKIHYRDSGPIYVKYKGWDISKSKKIYPIKINSASSDGRVNASYSMSSSDIYIKHTKYNEYSWNTELQRFWSILIHKLENMNFKNLNFLTFNKDSLPSVRYFVPLYIETEAFPNTILWYFPTKEFVNRLPERYQKIVKDYYKIRESIVDTLIPLNRPKSSHSKSLKDKYIKNHNNKISKIPTIDLTKEELANLGITLHKKTNEKFITDNEFYLYTSEMLMKISSKKIAELAYKMGIDTNYKKIVIKLPQMVSQSKIGTYGDEKKVFKWSSDTNDYSKVVPVAITQVTDLYYINRWKKNNLNMSMINIPSYLKNKVDDDIIDLLSETHEKLKKDTNYKYSNEWLSITNILIPIHCTLGNHKEIDGNQYSDIIFWFFPNKEFLDKLPERYSNPIRKELNIIKDVHSGKTTFAEACKGFTDESYLGICSRNSGAISNLSIYPNPVKNQQLHLKFILSENRKINISIYDINGNPVNVLLKNQYQKSGELEFSFNLKNLSNGIYQIAVTTEKNEVILSKLIVQ